MTSVATGSDANTQAHGKAVQNPLTLVMTIKSEASARELAGTPAQDSVRAAGQEPDLDCTRTS